MKDSFVEEFAAGLLYQWLQNVSEEDLSFAEVLLYDPDSMKEKYSASYFSGEQAYILYRTCEWEEVFEASELIFSSVIEEIESSKDASDICNSIIRLAKEERLLPLLTRCDVSEEIDQ
ncbi:MAG: hypothetical protein F4058_02940 [Rhodothermaceae bacterium]|nr:hypothetical protein [Rhodothermaceae bacterium]MYF63221.1 hypothetical protein [Rhodothermaceae bacterium]MYI84270.1 hypothetical protein [Rhodothermaceae bacterium]